MERLRVWRIWLVGALALAAATAQTVTPTNFSSKTTALQKNDTIQISVMQGKTLVPLAAVLILTTLTPDGEELVNFPLMGTVFVANANNQASLNSDQIAAISCDPSSGMLDAGSVFQTAASKDAKAVLFYSEKSDFCDFSDYAGAYAAVFTMKSASDSAKLIAEVNTQDSANLLYATIGPGTPHTGNGGDGSAAGDSPSSKGNNHNPLGPSPTTAVAMIILYSITGIITLLFLAIIVTGALRAHRHPERYGPQNTIGRPRQSRAKGLARAFLDTLPIVKFGDREDVKPADTELGDISPDAPREVQSPPTTITETPAQTETEQAEGIAAATTNAQPSAEENKGCSICTEDFEAGQDQRVLPCDHRFHPECVDPWLLNVSGTCPLCRIDLRPEARASAEEGPLQEGEFEPPPLEPEHRLSIRQSIVLGLTGVRPDRMTREERVQALRRMRREQPAASTEDQRRLGRRLRERLGIRTRRTGQESQEPQEIEATAEENSGRET